jgi:hypothetical protein
MSDRNLSQTPIFQRELGRFFGAWTSAEATIDFSIGKLLKITHEESHLITATLEFGRKITLLRSLVSRHRSKNKETIIKCLNTLQNESKRNVFAHSYIGSTKTVVTFIERIPYGKFSANELHPVPKTPS